ncbi:MAG: DNA polymerase III subunit delta [Bacteroidales bacterium]|nr:DNA polymerase III subunit delta [Bacteroidales bacterium]MEE1143215.1 DNA polymerase III subunit delta [Bacteroidales bacterium]MEE1226594.1 DNA polymerase III subunit delta [Bacteroidales bacterium]
MAVKKIEEILSHFDKRQFSPVYLLTGEENYYIDLLTSKFEEEILDEAERDFNLTTLYGLETNAKEICSFAKQYPIMSEKRLIIVKEFQQIDKKELSQLSFYVERPLASTILVLVNKNKTIDKKFSDKVNKSGIVFESAKLYENKVIPWIDKYVRDKRFSIETSATSLIFECLGNNLQKIANEIDKMSINLKEGSQITQSDVANHIGVNKDYNIFELQNAIGRLNHTKINKIVNYLLANTNENPIQAMLPNLFAYFVKVIITAQLKDKTNESVASAIGVSPYFAKDYIYASQIFPLEKLYQNIEMIKDYDLKTKGLGSNFDNNELFKELIFKLTH